MRGGEKCILSYKTRSQTCLLIILILRILNELDLELKLSQSNEEDLKHLGFLIIQIALQSIQSLFLGLLYNFFITWPCDWTCCSFLLHLLHWFGEASGYLSLGLCDFLEPVESGGVQVSEVNSGENLRCG